MRVPYDDDLRAYVLPPTRNPERADAPVVVLLHGFGAAGDDLAGLGPALARSVPDARFVFLEAPTELDITYLGGRAWWPVDMAARARQAEGVVDTKREPEGLTEARTEVLARLARLRARLTPSRLVLGGFSQGAMLAFDTALRSDVPLDGLVFLSGTHIAEEAWSQTLATRKDVPTFVSHGRVDSLLPFHVSERLVRLMTEAGLDVTFVPFDDGHGIPPELLPKLGAFLARALAR